jgi:sialate O-acetylesterase
LSGLTQYAAKLACGIVILGSALVERCAAQGDIRLPAVFSDKMVLQRNTRINIWGEASPAEELTVVLGESSMTTKVGEDGKWSVEVPSPPEGGPYELIVEGKNARVAFSDVLIGEVWLCSGQSNMQWSIEASVDIPDPEKMKEYLASITDSRIRFLTVPRNAAEEPSDVFSQPAGWTTATPESIREFSATAWYFATALRENESMNDIPIGLIHSSWGGTPGEAWVSREALEKHESLKPLLKEWDENASKGVPNRPASLFNGMIAPILPWSIRGVIWYQGEANVGRSEQYATILPALINDWRERFGQGELPFYLVQLAPFRYGNKSPSELAEIWDVQRRMLDIPNVGVAGSSDIGNPQDIHPKNKSEVGRRLALIARNNIYGEDTLAFSGPVYHSYNPLEGTNKVCIKFQHAAGLNCKEPDTTGSITGFEIAGEDGKYVPATATIEGDTVVVFAEGVARPVSVRYLWDDTSVCTLFNEAGLPALPFRAGQ